MSSMRRAARELERSLEQLVRLLDASSTPAETLVAASRECGRCFEELRGLSPGDDVEVRAALTRALRFNAIALELADRNLGKNVGAWWW